MLKNEEILFLGINAWDTIVQRPQHLATGLARNNRVFYVDPTAYSVLTKLATVLGRERKTRGWKPSLRRVSASLFVFSPPPMFPLSMRSSEINRLNNRILAWMLNRVFASIHLHPRILWASFPLSSRLVERMPADLVCYDCMDNYAAFYQGRRSTLLKEEEIRLLQRTDVAFATDPVLAERFENRCARIHLLPNAAHPDFLTKEGFPCPPELASHPKPVIGYVGSLSHWVDLDLLCYIASKRPNWSFVMIGPTDRIRIPKHLSNLHFTGEKRYEDVPAYVDNMDVCIIPFVVNELTQTVNPVKLYEYLARGKPVVATNTRAMRPFTDVCCVAKDREHFLAGIDEALRENKGKGAPRFDQRIRLAQTNTWDHRVREVEEILGNLLKQKRNLSHVSA